MEESKDVKKEDVKCGGNEAGGKNVVAVHNKNVSIECLPSEIFIMVFEHLRPPDRMRIEQVSNRWKDLAKDWSWSKYKVVSKKHFPGKRNWTETDAKLLALSHRCYRFVREFSFQGRNVTRTTYDSLSMLTNLKHLDLSCFPMDSTCFSNVAVSFPNLVSVVLAYQNMESLEGVAAILMRCEKIEILTMLDYCYRFDGYQFSKLPTALKCVHLDGRCGSSAFLDRIIAQKIQLVSLGIAYVVVDLNLLSRIDFTRLKYLSLRLDNDKTKKFSHLLWHLSNLHGLKLVLSGISENLLEELCDSIVTKCEKLKHFELDMWCEKKIDADTLIRLADLPDLCSIYLHFFDPQDNHAHVNVLFDKLVQRGNLQYFRTNTRLEVSSICQAISQCKGFTHLFYQSAAHEVLAPLFKALKDVHEGEAPPIYKTDKRILHTNFGRNNRVRIRKKPWVKLYSSIWGSPSNKVKEQICYGECSSKPSFLESYSN